MRLQLTRRGDYAIRGMLCLASDPGEILSGPEIGRRAQIPDRLVVQIMGELVHAGLVEARLGRRGGYHLARPASAIHMLSIVQAVEGDRQRQQCVLRGTACRQGDTCLVHDIFGGAQEAFLSRLSSATLASAFEA